MMTHLKIIKKKIANAINLHERMNFVGDNPNEISYRYLWQEYEKTSEIVSAASQINEDVSKLESDSYFLTEEQIKLLEHHVSIFSVQLF